MQTNSDKSVPSTSSTRPDPVKAKEMSELLDRINTRSRTLKSRSTEDKMDNSDRPKNSDSLEEPQASEESQNVNKDSETLVASTDSESRKDSDARNTTPGNQTDPESQCSEEETDSGQRIGDHENQNNESQQSKESENLRGNNSEDDDQLSHASTEEDQALVIDELSAASVTSVESNSSRRPAKKIKEKGVVRSAGVKSGKQKRMASKGESQKTRDPFTPTKRAGQASKQSTKSKQGYTSLGSLSDKKDITELSKFPAKNYFQDSEELKNFRLSVESTIASLGMEGKGINKVMQYLEYGEEDELECPDEACVNRQKQFRFMVLEMVESIVREAAELRRRMVNSAKQMMTAYEELMDKDRKEEDRLGDKVNMMISKGRSKGYSSVRKSFSSLADETCIPDGSPYLSHSFSLKASPLSANDIIMTIRICNSKGCCYFQPITSGNNFASHYRRFHPSEEEDMRSRFEGFFTLKSVSSAEYQDHIFRWNRQKCQRFKLKDKDEEDDSEDLEETPISSPPKKKRKSIRSR